MSKLAGVLGTLMMAGACCGAAHAQQAAPLAAGVTGAMATVKGPADPALGPGQRVVPFSSVERAEDRGLRARTHYGIVVPPQGQAVAAAGASPAVGPPFAGYYDETPSSLFCIYILNGGAANGCDPNKYKGIPTGGSRAIAVVDAYDLPSAVADLQQYSTQFGLPQANFQVVFATGTRPAQNSGWSLESALDIEMAHALAPSAKVYLVEAASASFADLNVAVDKAYQLVAAAGGGQISMSYGGAEFAGQTSQESHFNKTSALVTFYASTGDAPGTNYPSTSPNVVAVGGTATSRERINPARIGYLSEETAWRNSGGGVSSVFARPSYQDGVASQFFNLNRRAVPDVSAVGSDDTTVWVYCGTACGGPGWFHVYGTSASSPLVASIANRSAKFRHGSARQLANMYSQVGTTAFFDVKRGVCGSHASILPSNVTSVKATAYDLCTGLGSPRGASAF